MSLEKLYKDLEDLSPDEIKTTEKMIQALKRTRISPLAYIEELLSFKYGGFDEEKNAYIHQMLITDELKNRYQILHGGITSTFIDTAMASTIFQAMGEEIKVVTTDLSVRFLAPAVTGWLTAYTQIIKKGKTLLVLESKLEDEQKSWVATASSTFFVLEGE
ncbi:PaaI family thioesterase [Thermoflavimicrobium daqui]|uniref:Thioesterase domain-containing protein n=1 Tax=Thermoflavimicrobium daqui TaxID=2137476 RepID=A0A364K646_9BACL|nr:PaaI family thioesterase [Thermoflavimicrobium daqui]RAL25660.1 hypothetical protein DL897_06165 [Thermoflavimicrobium daqui]